MKRWIFVLLAFGFAIEAKELRECETASPGDSKELMLLSNSPALEGEKAKAILDKAIELLQSNHDPNLCFGSLYDELTPLFAAMINDNVPLMKILMNMDVDLDGDGVNDYTAPYVTDQSLVGDLYVTQRDIKQNPFPKSILMYAAQIGSKAIDFIIEQDSDLVKKSTRYGLPIHAAAEGGQIEAFEKLEKAGAEINAKGAYGKKALHYAARTEWLAHEDIESLTVTQLPMIDYLVNEKDFEINEKDDSGIPPYQEAAYSYNVVAMEHMEKLGADPLLEDKYNVNALDAVALTLVTDVFEKQDLGDEERKELVITNEIRRLEATRYLVEKAGIIPTERTLVFANGTLGLVIDEDNKYHKAAQPGLEEFISYLESQLP